ncbi:MAG: 2-thiouracil desulfurase family protein, partial [Candidatus Deferrimicrobiaceae bacterium]
MPEPVRILVSACLLGEKVRYDGGHKRDLFLIEMLGPFVEWVRVCPEVDCGLPVPREA